MRVSNIEPFMYDTKMQQTFHVFLWAFNKHNMNRKIELFFGAFKSFFDVARKIYTEKKVLLLVPVQVLKIRPVECILSIPRMPKHFNLFGSKSNCFGTVMSF